MTQPFVLPEVSSLLASLAEQGGPHLADMSAADMRATYLQLGTAFDAPTEPGVRWTDLNGAGCPLRAYFPGEAKAGPVILFMHGGGWVIGDLESHHPLCTTIAAITGLRVVAVDYRLAPEHVFPAAHDDSLAAARFVVSSPPELEAPVTGIAVAGDSAGANLALYVSTQMGPGKVLAQFLIYPVGDCTEPDGGSYNDFKEGYILDRKLMGRFIADYLPDSASVGGPVASPALHPTPADLPATLVLTAGLDPLRDQGRAIVGAIAQTGVEVHLIEAQGLIHGLATMRAAFPTADVVMRRAISVFAEIMHARNA